MDRRKLHQRNDEKKPPCSSTVVRKRVLESKTVAIDGTHVAHGNSNNKKQKHSSLEKSDGNGSVGTRSNILGDGSSVYAELRARNLSALAASPGSSLRSINSLSEGQELDAMNALRQVPVMESEAQSKQESNNPSDTREKDALEKSTTGTTHARQNLVRGTSLLKPDRMHLYKTAKPSSLRDSDTQVDIYKMQNNASAGSAALSQQQHTRQGLVSLNKYYIQNQQQHMKTMSNLVNHMAQAAGEMIKQGHNPSSLNMSAAIRACSLANVIIYKSGCLARPSGTAPVADPRAKLFSKGPVFPAPPGPDNERP